MHTTSTAPTVAPPLAFEQVNLSLSPDNHALLSELLLAGVRRLKGAERARIRRLATACKVDGDRLWGVA